jgi:hypothetical protein
MGLIRGTVQLGNPIGADLAPLMDLVLRPQLQAIDVNPESPNLSSAAQLPEKTGAGAAREQQPPGNCGRIQLRPAGPPRPTPS